MCPGVCLWGVCLPVVDRDTGHLPSGQSDAGAHGPGLGGLTTALPSGGTSEQIALFFLPLRKQASTTTEVSKIWTTIRIIFIANQLTKKMKKKYIIFITCSFACR